MATKNQAETKAVKETVEQETKAVEEAGAPEVTPKTQLEEQRMINDLIAEKAAK